MGLEFEDYIVLIIPGGFMVVGGLTLFLARLNKPQKTLDKGGKMKQSSIPFSKHFPKRTQWIITIGLLIATGVATWKGADPWHLFLGAISLLIGLLTIISE